LEQDVNSADRSDADAFLQQQMEKREAKWHSERAVVLRVYNYYRIVLSFFLLILFYEVPGQTFVGSLSPDWFQTVMLLYLMLNVGTGFVVLVSKDERVCGIPAVTSIVVLDIFFLSILLFTSGGINSGLGYLLVFSVSFGSVMLAGSTSFLFPAIAAVNSISSELYLHNTGSIEGSQHLFQTALLGTSFFMVNYFFQYVSKKIDERGQEVVSLSALSQAHKVAEESRRELEISNSRFTVLLSSTDEGVIGLDMQGEVTFANPSSCQILDIDYGDLIGSSIQRFMIEIEPHADNPRQQILELLEVKTDLCFDPVKWQTARGDSFIVQYTSEATVDKAGEMTGAVLILQNVTQQRENEERIQYLVNFDDLTGLPNRTNFQEAVKSAMARTRRTSSSIAILIVDTDHITVINEKMGHEAGDQTLKEIARRLKSAFREGDMVARLHGDQFAIMLADLDRAENAAIAADKIIKDAAAPMTIKGTALSTSVSVGIAVMDEEHSNSDDIISAAVSAVEHAKGEGRSTYRFYHPKLQQKAEEKKRVQILLRTATDNDEFELMYQPIISVMEERIYSSEALIRWFPADSDSIRPDIFIPIAEESGQISNIGLWVLSTVSRQVKRWKEDLGVYPSVAINISSKQLRNSIFREQFQAMLKDYDIPVEVVELELTETGVMEDPEKCLEELLKLHETGVKISIDDFGTGYSSLDYLRRLPLDILKIDQSFTFGIGESENDEEIVRVMIRMAHAMGLKVICEGVETREQFEFLREHECDLVQGFYFSKPRTVDKITELFIAESSGTIDIMAGEAG